MILFQTRERESIKISIAKIIFLILKQIILISFYYILAITSIKINGKKIELYIIAFKYR